MNIFTIPFMQTAIIAVLLASISFGILGSIIVVKRISNITGAISHCILGGIGASLFFQNNYGISWFNPVIGAICAAIISALTIGFVSIYANKREDTIISSVWVIGMSIGVLFISKTSGYTDMESYLFGNLLMISGGDIIALLIVDAVVLILVGLFYYKILAICFDYEFAMLRGINTKLYHFSLLIIISVAIVFLIRIVGIVMVIAMLTLPAAIAGEWVNKLWKTMLLATILCIIYNILGLILSFNMDLPAGATIICILGISYISLIIIKKGIKNG